MTKYESKYLSVAQELASALMSLLDQVDYTGQATSPPPEPVLPSLTVLNECHTALTYYRSVKFARVAPTQKISTRLEIPESLLTDMQVTVIQRLHAQGLSMSRLADMFKCKHSEIRRLVLTASAKQKAWAYSKR